MGHRRHRPGSPLIDIHRSSFVTGGRGSVTYKNPQVSPPRVKFKGATGAKKADFIPAGGQGTPSRGFKGARKGQRKDIFESTESVKKRARDAKEKKTLEQREKEAKQFDLKLERNKNAIENFEKSAGLSIDDGLDAIAMTNFIFGLVS